MPLAQVVAGGFLCQSLLAVRAWPFYSCSGCTQLPGALLGRLTGTDLPQRLCYLLVLLMPVSTSSWSGYPQVAREQQAKSLELRAALSLSRLWVQNEQSQKARKLLEPIFASFTEGLDTKNLRDAKSLLK
jgi:hypothetical protein